MARSRNIKPGFFSNEVLAECGVWARLCFAGLWTLADREGRLEDRPKRIKGDLFRFDSVEVEPLLTELAEHGFLLRYENDDGRFIQILAFKKHQAPHHTERASVIKPPGTRESTRLPQRGSPDNSGIAPGVMAASTPPRSPLIPDSLIPDSPNHEEDVSAASLRAAPPSAPPPAFDGNNGEVLNGKAVVQLDARWELPESWGLDAEALGWKPAQVLREAERFRQYWVVGDGKGKRRSVKGWRQSWSNWLGKAERMQR
jgi:hypothetical protein